MQIRGVNPTANMHILYVNVDDERVRRTGWMNDCTRTRSTHAHTRIGEW